ncbi:Pullulanase [Lacunisphaera limnophila]|uniref:Pullulanase n=1 Tax=Lacunisphaera limnophila TaxID=1838286 RepID=A0A1D8AW80_9BACT|nr:alpha-amylase family glycosyl hydrolase [Lacunisphaera limnophila]AOS45154.1 Pullulanase [Lacunisphaera limnophila]
MNTRAPFNLELAHRIARAWLTSTSSGIIEMGADWTAESLPLLTPGDKAFEFSDLSPAEPSLYADEAAYYVDDAGQVVFMLDPAEHSWVNFTEMPVYVAGDFNGWQAAVGQPDWSMVWGDLNGRRVLLLRKPAAGLLTEPPAQFKFVTGDGRWLDLPRDATNVVAGEGGRTNRLLKRHRTGRNLFRFTTAEPVLLNQTYSVILVREGREPPKVRVRLGKFFHALRSDLPLGARVSRGETTFRLFAPRAKHVRLFLCEKLEDQNKAFGYELDRRTEDHGWSGVWEAHLNRNLHGWYYWYSVSGPHDVFGHFHPTQKILDPYALAAVSRDGPGIVLDPAWVGRADRSFATPAWQDLVMVEGHVRDLAAHAPLPLTADERLGFTGLTKWVESPDFYLKKLGVNCVELQPVHQADNTARGEYFWGYMPVSYFAPAADYGLDGAHASQVKELQALVAAFHRQGMAVVIDVVYNHVGVPAHLMFIDKLYYFEVNDEGVLANWSGCGNDLRARSAMATRLIIDSLVHLIEVYGVDGFRFDLAELIGVDVLRDIEAAVKRVKPDVILIAEPWSFRGHIAAALRPTGYASWNDNYRDFVRGYVHGRGAADTLEYFLKGSPWHFAYWPAQTVNYTESHDDSTWIDVITENPGHNGHQPTQNDRQRTHLMAAILFSSVGIPLVSAGQDFLRSKHGVNNTYLRGDLNALDYRRAARFPATHKYFADWIAFRRSPRGQLMRLWARPSEGYFQCFGRAGHPALIAIYNADGSHGPQKLMFAINPHTDDTTMPIGTFTEAGWRMVADHECFYPEGTDGPLQVGPEGVYIPGLGCSLWIAG